ncbi:MAG: hypothetical protein U5N26_12165 [Candidatus Marinimicrobia bacterium]|nr:hypothetical protein [Candidatus Neomarinimicrobiota bacterium]
MPGLTITTIRVALIIVPLAILFTRVFHMGVQGVFIAQIAASALAAVLAYFWLSNNLKKIEQEEITYGEPS